MAKVKEIYKTNEKGEWIQDNKLLLKDSRFWSNERSISFITYQGHEKLKNDEVKGFCHFKFRSNLVIEAIDSETITPSSILHVGDSSIEITAVGKKCHEHCPALVDNNCSLSKHIFWGKAKKQGSVTIGDTVTISNPS